MVPERCVFPFVFLGVESRGCTRRGDPAGRPWCSVQVDPKTGAHVMGKDRWGHCQEGCPVEGEGEEKECITVRDLIINMAFLQLKIAGKNTAVSSNNY